MFARNTRRRVWLCAKCAMDELTKPADTFCGVVIYHKTLEDANRYCDYARKQQVTDCQGCKGMTLLEIIESLWINEEK